MTFLSVQPLGKVGHFSLPIIRGSLEVVPDVDISITDLNRNKDGSKYKHFFNTGDGGITFKCTVVMDKNATYQSQKFTKVLNDWYVKSTPVDVSTDAIDIPNGTYLITKNSNRTQTSNNYSEWDLEFTTYKELTIWKYKNDNETIVNAIKKAKADKIKKVKNAHQTKLSKCDLKVLVYSKKKKSVKCVKYLQKILQLEGFYLKNKIDGWYGADTKKAVKAYQKKNKGKVLFMKVNGKVDGVTFFALCGDVLLKKKISVSRSPTKK